MRYTNRLCLTFRTDIVGIEGNDQGHRPPQPTMDSEEHHNLRYLGAENEFGSFYALQNGSSGCTMQLGHYNENTVNAQFIASDLEYEVINAITLQVIDVSKICNSAQVGPSPSWALVLCTCCTIHCYATGQAITTLKFSTFGGFNLRIDLDFRKVKTFLVVFL